MLRNSILPLFVSLGLLASCAPSPLYVQKSSKYRGTVGEVPRDGRGEPLWPAIHTLAPAPPEPDYPPAPGIPITPPR